MSFILLLRNAGDEWEKLNGAVENKEILSVLEVRNIETEWMREIFQ
jgi:hypothetical protein